VREELTVLLIVDVALMAIITLTFIVSVCGETG
jgi:hypothetical protein